MVDGGMTVLDGSHLRSLQVSLPDSEVTLTGAQVLDWAESKASDALFGLSLPPCLKSSALRRVNVDDDVSFRHSELIREAATSKLNDYITAIADELKGIIFFHQLIYIFIYLPMYIYVTYIFFFSDYRV